MNILIITKNFPPKTDGVGDYSFHLSNYLSKFYNVHIATSANKPFDNSCCFFHFKNWDKKEFELLKKYIKENNIQVVLLQYVPYSFGKRGIPINFIKNLERLQVKIITTFHEVRIKLIPWQRNFIVGLAQALCAKKLYKISSQVITSNAHYATLVAKKDNENKISIIPIGSNLNGFIDEQRNFSIKNKTKKQFTLVSFGQEIRSFRIILEAAQIAQKKIPELKILFLGKLSDSDKILKTAANLGIENILELTGKLKASEIHYRLKQANVYLMLENTNYGIWHGTSFRSGTLAAAIEAGLPIIGNKGELNNQELISNEGVFLLNTTNKTTLSEKIIELYSSNRVVLKPAIDNLFKNFVCWEKITLQYKNIIKRML